MIAAVIVTHAAPIDTVTRCVASVARPPVDAVVVVGNGAPEHRAALRERLAAVPPSVPVEVVGAANDGYGAAADVGFRWALARGADAVALLNDDLVVRDGWLPPLAEALRADGVGAAQPKLLVAGSSPAVVNSLGVAIGRDGAGTDVGDGDPDTGSGGVRPIDAFTGGAVLLSAAFLRATGGFDPRWFLYYEDADLSARGRALGWRYVVVLDSVVEHERGATTGAAAGRTRYLQERNRLWHAVRHCDAATVGRAVWLSVRRLRHAPYGVHARALASGLAGAPRWAWRRARHRDVVPGTGLREVPGR